MLNKPLYSSANGTRFGKNSARVEEFSSSAASLNRVLKGDWSMRLI